MFRALALALLLSCWALYRTEGFTVAKVSLPVRGALSESGYPIPSGPFRYLAKGRQCYVFENDGVVLKLFKNNAWRLPEWMPGEEQRSRRKGLYLSSYKLAFELLREETGLSA